MFIKKGGQRNAKIKIKRKEEFRSPFYQLYRSMVFFYSSLLKLVILVAEISHVALFPFTL